MSLIKKPYELSVWSENLSIDGIKEEKMGAIIGAHDMGFLGKATNVVLKTEIKGTATLTFDMPSKFFDSTIGDYIHNELTDIIKNESKIKLNYKNKWYEFYVKKIVENKKFKAIMYTYTCQDSFIDELSRTGYEIQFDDKLNNSVNEAGIFMEDILDMSVWDYTPEYNTGDFTEFNEQKFYKIPLSQFGGKITAYKVDLEVKIDDFYLNGEIKPYIKKYAKNKELDWDKMNKDEQEDFLKKAMLITNVLNNTKRDLEYGDDLARERELFWDCYYKDNGRALISEENQVELNGEYIYVPITDLTMIIGSIYEDAKAAVEEPALYGTYPDTSYGYALQPVSKNPRAFIQIINLPDGAIYNIDEEGVLANNDYHYIIRIEDWNSLLKEQLKDKEGLIYWRAPVGSNNVKKTLKYSLNQDSEYIYTTDAQPSSSVVDDFNWYPVYSDGYLSSINNTEVTMARKISIIDRTEYNKAADAFVTVYNNKSNEYLDNNQSLYTEEELTNQVKNGKEFRVCSKLQTRQILPTLSRNLIQNGTQITDTNGWEAKTQNNNKDEISGTGSYKSLMQLEVHPTFESNTDFDEVRDLDGTVNDEIISDYYLKVLSPKLNKCIDFSKEGEVEFDYVLNFGMISQEYSIEKDKVYAIRLKTGTMIYQSVSFTYRSGINTGEDDVIKDKNKIIDAVNTYEKTMNDYYNLITAFGRDKKNTEIVLENLLGNNVNEHVDLFYSIIDTLNNSDETQIKKLKKTIDENLYVLLFGNGNGGEGTWGFNGASKQIIGLVDLYDRDKTKKYEQIKNIALKGNKIDSSSIVQSNSLYTNSDIKYLKYYLYAKVSSISEKEINSVTPLTYAFANSWKTTYIKYNKIFNDRINEDLDKIVIGKGSLDNNGNYIIEGTDNKGNEYISFSNVFDTENVLLYFVPDCQSNMPYENNKDLLTKPIYHNKNEFWKYEKEIGDASLSVKDDVYLLFKANQTITNPYIGIKVESSPMLINFDQVEETIYEESTSTGVVFNFTNQKNEYLNNVKIELVKIDKISVSDRLKNAIKFDEKTGTIGVSEDSIKNFEFNKDDLKTSRPTWTGMSSVENPLINTSFLLNKNEDKSFPYLVFINGECQGLIYLSKENGGEK